MRTNQIVKYSLFGSCYIFWVASGLMIAVGIYAKLCKETSLVDSLTTDPSIILIVVGILMFSITFIGCMGALRDIHVLLKIFAWMLLLVLILQFVAAVLGFIFSGMFECCGVKSYRDWSQNIYFYCEKTNPSLESCAVPYSCCIRGKEKNVINTMCGYQTQSLKEWDAEELIHIEGCLERIVSWGQGNLLLLGGLTMGLIFLEILVTCLAVIQIYQINIIMNRRKSTVTMSTEPRVRIPVSLCVQDECVE
ncbi:tetraspanin-33-like isoform 2-T2 [Discoglossus pictus]